MGTFRLINGSTKTGSPVGIMHTNILVKRHPVGNRRFIIFAFQRCITLFVCNAVHTSRCVIAFCGITGYKIRFHHELSVLIEEQMLCGQVNLYISITIIRRTVRSCRLIIDRRPLSTLAIFNHFFQFFGFLIIIHPPAIIPAVNGDFFSIAGHKGSGTENGIIFLPKSSYIIFHLGGVQFHFKSVHMKPGADRCPVQYFLLVSEGIRNGKIRIFLHFLKGRL